jgi:hypothetical protein
MEAETVAFGYPRHAPSLTASDGLALLSRAWDFRSDLVRVAEVFFGNKGTADFLRI